MPQQIRFLPAAKAELLHLPLLTCLGTASRELSSAYEQLATPRAALAAAAESLWQDARTEALGDLTAAITVRDPDAMACWNPLSDAIGALVFTDLLPPAAAILREQGLEALLPQVEFDLAWIGLYLAYSTTYKSLPDFSGCLLQIYRQGHLPCGWSGAMSHWPSGRLQFY